MHMYSQTQKNPGCPFDVGYNKNVLKIMKIYSNSKGMHYFMENCPLIHIWTQTDIYLDICFVHQKAQSLSACAFM